MDRRNGNWINDQADEDGWAQCKNVGTCEKSDTKKTVKIRIHEQDEEDEVEEE